MLNCEALSAWIGSRLNPNGKCRIKIPQCIIRCAHVSDETGNVALFLTPDLESHAVVQPIANDCRPLTRLLIAPVLKRD